MRVYSFHSIRFLFELLKNNFKVLSIAALAAYGIMSLPIAAKADEAKKSCESSNEISPTSESTDSENDVKTASADSKPASGVKSPFRSNRMKAVTDPDTGQLRLPTVEEIGEEDLKRMRLNRSSEGLVEETLPDGTVIVRLKGRYKFYRVKRTTEKGKLEKCCITQKGEVDDSPDTEDVPHKEDEHDK